MPQESYGRKVKAQSDYGATQRAYQYSPRAAQEYLSGDQAAAYESARKEAYTPFLPGQGFRAHRPQIDQREAAFDRMERLRELAGTNALGGFTEQAGQLSKPYRLTAAQGFLTEEPMSRDEPVMTAYPKKMGSLSDPASYAARRQALTTRQDAPDEAFNLLKDDDKRLKLRAQVMAAKQGVGLGSSSPGLPGIPSMPVMPTRPTGAFGSSSQEKSYNNAMAQYNRQYAEFLKAMEDPEKAYVGY